MNFEKIKRKVSITDNSKKIIDFFYWNISWVLLLILLALSGYCILVWYQYVYHPHWSQARIQEYTRSKNASAVTFDKTGFGAIMNEKKARKTDYQKTFDNTTGDIFQLKTITATDTQQK